MQTTAVRQKTAMTGKRSQRFWFVLVATQKDSFANVAAFPSDTRKSSKGIFAKLHQHLQLIQSPESSSDVRVHAMGQIRRFIVSAATEPANYGAVNNLRQLQAEEKYCVADRLLDLLTQRKNCLKQPGCAHQISTEETYAALDLLQGLCLTDSAFTQSRFRIPKQLTILLDCLDDPTAQVRVAALEALQSALVDSSDNMRNFESLGGLQTVTNLLKHRQLAHQARLKCLEFLFVYLSPEPQTAQESVARKRERLAALVGEAFVRKLLKTISLDRATTLIPRNGSS